jgi:catechol 2,3-dioxygenase-like lactoylglutathione lyase family enzyme
VALAVGDLSEMVARLADAGIEPEARPYNPGGREELTVCFVRDPDGVRVELIDGDFPLPNDSLPAQAV